MPIWVRILFVAIFLGALVVAVRNEASIECEVCVEFGGQRVCRTNLGADRKSATYGATSAACAVLSNGVTAGIQCSNTPPRSVRCED